MTWFEKLFDHISSLSLVLVGVVGLVIGIADYAKNDDKILYLILLTTATLSIGLGIERVIRFRRLEQHLSIVSKLLTGSIGCHQLVGQNEVYGTAIRLANTAQSQIRALVIGKSTKAPPEFAEAIARKLRESKQSGVPIKYEAALVVDFEKATKDFYDGIDRRLSTYKKFGVSDLAEIYLLDLKPPTGFDMFIVDRNHVIIGITKLSGVNSLQQGLLFENQPAIASEFADWYDQNIIRQTISYERWVHTQNQT
ncbi:MAG: hypothetical protein AAB354_05915 [candidate division KSB1 bacterium]